MRDLHPGRWAVAVEDSPAAGAGGRRGAVGVEDQGPAPAVNDDEVVEGAQGDQVMQGGGPTRRAGDEVVDVAHAGGLFAAGERAKGVAGGDGTAQVSRDGRLSLGDIQREREQLFDHSLVSLADARSKLKPYETEASP